MNGWNEYPKKKPSKSGLYLAVIKLEDTQLTKILFYESERQKWLNYERLMMFSKYEVYSTEPGPDGSEVLVRKLNDELCDFTNNVVMWKELPKWLN